MEQRLLINDHDDTVEYLEGIEEEAKMWDIQYLQLSKLKCCIYGFMVLLSAGIFYLISRWFNKI